MFRCLAVCVALCGVFTGVSEAYGPKVSKGLRVAPKFWQGNYPLCGTPRVIIHARLIEHDVRANADTRACVIRIVHDPSTADVCTSIVHEWGHLLGLAHDDDPRSVMSARGAEAIAKGCEDDKDWSDPLAVRPRRPLMLSADFLPFGQVGWSYEG